jgi:hypothetical protein
VLIQRIVLSSEELETNFHEQGYGHVQVILKLQQIEQKIDSRVIKEANMCVIHVLTHLQDLYNSWYLLKC